MGRALEPGQKFPIVLDWDMDKPEAERPTIFTSALSGRKHMRLADRMDNFINCSSSKELFQQMSEGLAEVITGWKNFRNPDTGEEIPYSPDAILDWLTTAEMREVYSKVLSGGNVSKADEKNSASQP